MDAKLKAKKHSMHKKEEDRLKIKQQKSYTVFRQNCCNTRPKFFTEDMELVSELDFVDPNKATKKQVIAHKQQMGILSKTNGVFNVFNESNLIHLTHYYHLPFLEFPNKKIEGGTKYDKKKITDELIISEIRRKDLENKKNENIKMKNKHIHKIVSLQEEIYNSRQDVDLLDNFMKYNPDYKKFYSRYEDQQFQSPIVKTNFSLYNLNISNKKSSVKVDSSTEDLKEFKKIEGDSISLKMRSSMAVQIILI